MQAFCHICKREQASISCNCRDPPVYLCEGCLGSHIIAQKTVRHVTEQLQLQEPPVEVQLRCSVCDTHQAQIICLCKGRKTRLCHGCIPFHMNKHPKSPHPMEQLQADDLIDDSNGSLQQYLERKQIVDYLINEARTNLNTIFKYKEKVNEAYSSLQEIILSQLQSSLEEADQIESFIENLIEHLESTRYEKSLNDKDWAHILVKKANHANLSLVATELKMVKADINLEEVTQSIRNLSSLKIVRDPTKRDINVPYFKARTNEVFLFDTCSGSFSVNTLPNIVLKEVAGWTIIPSGQVFYCGGCENSDFSKEAYLIDTLSLLPKRLPDMNCARAFPALIYHQNFVYSFGGYTGTSIRQAEKFSIVNENWTRLPDMPIARSAFTIVEMHDKLYLAGDSRSIDVYDIYSNSYQTCNLTLPEAGTYLSILNIAKDLIFIQNDKIWSINSENGSSEEVCNIPNGKWWSHFPPIVHDGRVFLSRYDDSSIWEFSNGEISKLLRC